MERVSVVMITRNRAAQAAASVDRLLALPEKPPVVVVDNGSGDGTVELIAARGVEVISAGRNLGAAGRNLGVEAARTPYVAFCDDDTRWEPGALGRAADLFDAHPRLALISARTLVEPGGHEDPLCAKLASGLPARSGVPGTPILGFLACAAIVRRSAFLDAGGFEERLGIMGEEELLALDLSAAGWHLAYVPELVMYHAPSPDGDSARKRYLIIRNGLWTAWLRLPVNLAWRRTFETVRNSASDPGTRRALVDALRGAGWAVRARDPIPPHVAEAKAATERAWRLPQTGLNRGDGSVRHSPTASDSHVHTPRPVPADTVTRDRLPGLRRPQT